MSRGFLDCLKRERDIFIKPTLSGEKMAFMCTPALIEPTNDRTRQFNILNPNKGQNKMIKS